MRKSDIVSVVSDAIGISATKADDVVSSMVEQITNALARGEKINLTGFGHFSVQQRPARKGRNPQTGEPIDILLSNQVKFTAGKHLKEAIMFND